MPANRSCFRSLSLKFFICKREIALLPTNFNRCVYEAVMINTCKSEIINKIAYTQSKYRQETMNQYKAYRSYRKASRKSCLQFILESRMVQKIRGKILLFLQGHLKMGKNLADRRKSLWLLTTRGAGITSYSSLYLPTALSTGYAFNKCRLPGCQLAKRQIYMTRVDGESICDHRTENWSV